MKIGIYVRRPTLPQAVLCALICLATGAWAEDYARAAFTVRDSIEYEHVVRRTQDLQAQIQANPVGVTALASPGKRQLVFQTRRGLVAENLLQDTLWLIQAGELTEFLATPARRDKITPSVLLTRRTRSESGVISNIQWLNERELGFLAADDLGVRQAFAVEINRRGLRQLTFSDTDVTAFAARNQTILYYAVVAEPSLASISVTSVYTDLASIIDPATYSSLFPRVDLFVQKGTGAPRRVAAPPMRLLPDFQSIWISPDERFAVALQPAMAWPRHWEEYEFPSMAFQYSADRATPDGTSLALVNRAQYRLVDIRSRASSALLDAPIGLLSMNYTPARAFWLSDSSSVVISNAFLPLTESDGATRLQRARQPAIAEIHIASRGITPIVWEPRAIADPGGGRETVENPIVALEFLEDELIVHSADYRGSLLAPIDPKFVSAKVYAKVAGHWQQRLSESAKAPSANDLSLDVKQDLNTRPKLYASGGQCGCSKLMWDPNPRADRFYFGHAKVIKWRDGNGIGWQGGLILPPDHDARRRYPLVIQTHGFHSEEFLLDGPQGTTTAFAAQPLANAGFIVLQIEDNASAETNDSREVERFAEGTRSAILKLDRDELIDPSRVAAIGWSSTGKSVLHLIGEYPGTLAAAIVSDAAQYGYMSYLFRVNMPPAMRDAFIRFTGTEGVLKNPAEIIARDPTHEMASRAPPLRLEAIRPGSMLGMWETYALLRFANSPVDLVYYPSGSHSLQKPAERLASQQGSVAWLRFWLQDYEDPTMASSAQYELWRSFRKASDVRTTQITQQ